MRTFLQEIGFNDWAEVEDYAKKLAAQDNPARESQMLYVLRLLLRARHDGFTAAQQGDTRSYEWPA